MITTTAKEFPMIPIIRIVRENTANMILRIFVSPEQTKTKSLNWSEWFVREQGFDWFEHMLLMFVNGFCIDVIGFASKTSYHSYSNVKMKFQRYVQWHKYLVRPKIENNGK